MPPGERLGVCFSWCQLGFDELRELVLHAEARGYEAAYVDGDVTRMPGRGQAPVLDGWTVTTALALATRRIAVASLRVVHHWNAARLAQAVATLEHLAPGRQRLLISIGGRPEDRHFGLAPPPVPQRIAHLEETLAALRGLLRGEDVTLRGRYVELEDARVRPTPAPGRPPIEVAARGPRMLRVVATHADAWNLNLPPVRHRVLEAAGWLEEACRGVARPPEAIERVMAVFARPGADPEDPRLQSAFRRWNPWHHAVPDAELPEAVLAGEPSACRQRLAAIRHELGIALPLLDLTGLLPDAARQAIDALAPDAGRSAESFVDSGTC